MFDYGAAATFPPFSDEMSGLLRQILLRSSNQCNSADPQFTHVETNPSPQLQPIGVAADYDDPSEVGAMEGLEALVEEASKRRRSGKRRRAAEVHNMSEKRRRRRINEKLKALQELIPCSNKTDKAYMLDEAIEYLRQLQLQVQMLTLRNGLIMHPMCLPKAAQRSMLSVSNLSPEAVKLESSNLGDLFGLRPPSDVFFGSTQMNTH